MIIIIKGSCPSDLVSNFVLQLQYIVLFGTNA